MAQVEALAPATASEQDNAYREMLIGFYVDGVEKPALLVLFDGEDYLLPLDRVLDGTGAQISLEGDSLLVVTPAGTVELGREWLRVADGRPMVLRQALNELLMMEARFDQSTYALHVSPPWWQRRAKNQSPRVTPTPSYAPPSASVRNMRADFTWFHSDQRNDVWAEYYSAGNLAGGAWASRAEHDVDGDFRVFDYQWLRNTRHTQTLLGNSRFSIHPMVPTVETTGVQWLYSTTPLEEAGMVSLNDSDGSREVGSGTRNISGTSEPGAIAELRINGAVVARTRVRLDGFYEFADVDLSTRGYSSVEVLILDRNSGTLLEREDFSRRGGEGMLNANQHTVFASLGEQGNALDQDIDSRGTAGALQWRYGVTENFTAEISQQDDGEDSTWLVGTSLAFGGSWFGTLAYSNGADEDIVGITLDAGTRDWRLNMSTREFRVDRSDQPTNQWIRQGSYRYQVNRNLNIGVAGRDSRTFYEDQQFLLPTIGWSDGRSLSTTAAPNVDGNYRVDSRFTPTRRDTLRYTYEESNHFVDYRHQAGGGVQYYGTFTQGDQFSARYEVGFIARSDNRRFERTQVGVVQNSGGSTGYLVQWDSRLVPGVYSRLRVSDNAFLNESLSIDEGFSVQWDISLDFAISAGRVLPADSGMGRFGSAALTGRLQLGDAALPADRNITRIVLIIDGISHTADVQDGQYYIDGLEPGTRLVSMDSRYLPLELTPLAGQQFWVKLERSAATDVPFALNLSYAVAGTITSGSGEPLQYVSLAVLDEKGNRLKSVYSDQFGMYRVDGLAPGSWRLIVEDEEGALLGSRAVMVRDDFLFEQNIVVAEGQAPGL